MRFLVDGTLIILINTLWGLAPGLTITLIKKQLVIYWFFSFHDSYFKRIRLENKGLVNQTQLKN